ncbi:MAG: hypothetical protein R3C62_12830 [Chloroflexota bacterium]
MKRKRVLIGCAGVLGLVFLCGLISLFGSESEEAKTGSIVDEATVVADNKLQPESQSYTATAELKPEQSPNTPVPTVTTKPISTPTPTFTPIPEPTVTTAFVSDSGNGYQSGGLGISLADWEAAHNRSDLDYQPIGIGYDNKYDVLFQVDNVWMISRQWQTGSFATIEEAQSESSTLIPTDSQLIETYSPAGLPEITIDLYFSESLKARFDDEDSLFGSWWTGGEPGNFIVLFNTPDGEVSGMIISIGNNP